VSSPLEQRYRRVLRLLPAGYRQAWEEDMVASFLQSAEDTRSDRPTLGERLSVVWLATRLRLNGSHAAPGWAVWYHVVYGIGLLVLLYQAVAATATAGSTVGFLATSEFGVGRWYAPSLLSRFVGLLWVAAFACLVLRRVAAARTLATLAALAAIGVTIGIVVEYGPLPEPFGLGNLSRLGWLVVSAAIVIVVPKDAKASPSVWFGAYLVGSAVVLTFELRAFWPALFVPWPWPGFGNLTSVSSVALIAALAVAFARIRSAPHWLLAIGIVAGGLGGIRLARWSEQQVPPFDVPARISLTTMLDLALIGLAVVALAVGLLLGRRHNTALAREP
jgi:hypothetical protein